MTRVMTTEQSPGVIGEAERWLSQRVRLDIERLGYLAVLVLAVLTRFWDLGMRAMSHDEVVHIHNSWELYRGTGYVHAPWHHGPLLYHVTALLYYLFGDNDVVSRVYPAVVGVLIVMFPYLLRKWLGKTGALCASVFLLISPFVLYYSRYIRHDIPAIFFALVMAWASWHYMEERKHKWLIVLAVAQALLVTSKEVSFFYTAIFGSFFTLHLVDRLLTSPWEPPHWRVIFALGLAGIIVALTLLGVGMALPRPQAEALTEESTATLMETPLAEAPEEEAAGSAPLSPLTIAGIAVLGAAILVMVVAALIGQGPRLREYPALDICMVMGTLLLPMLSAFPIHWLGFDPMDEGPAGIQTSAMIATPMIVASIVIGVLWGVKPGADSDKGTSAIDYWLKRIARSRWWLVGGIYWLIFIFLFTTMFTNGTGVATGIVGSLGYWLAQQTVRRGGHPWYHFVFVTVPLYEFFPLILTAAAGILGLTRLFRRPASETASEAASQTAEERPGAFSAVRFIGFWAVGNLIIYSVAGERMPWLTVHITIPMILLGGWVVGQLLERIHWQDWRVWVLMALLPITVIALVRVLTPIVDSFSARTAPHESPTVGLWLVSILVFAGTFIATALLTLRVRLAQTLRAWAAMAVMVLAILTARVAWMATFINYNSPVEFLDFAFSSRATTLVADLVEEMSIRSTGGLDLQVAYDDRVSWTMMWHFRNYTHAIYYGDEPSRGIIGDAPVILAAESHWPAVEALLGDRYYQFEYMRMWWPMQDYFSLSWEEFLSGAANPDIRRGVWDIFWNRDFTAYGEAVGKSFDLNDWWPSERMRLYIRRDFFAQIWDQGVAATEIAEALDPYSPGHRDILPEQVFGQGMLNGPHGIAIGPDALLYVADTYDHRIAVFDQEGNFIRAIGTGRLNQPWDVAVSADGFVYVADTWNHRIQRFTLDGEFITEWGHEEFNPETTDPTAFYGPRGVAVDSEGNVYVVDTGNKRIVVFSPDGEFLRQIGSGGNLSGQLNEPVGIAVTDGGGIYVADTWNQRIQVFNMNGLYLDSWAMSAWYAQTNERPYLEVDSAGHVYVSDPNAFRILVFSGDGRYLYSFGDLSTLSLAGAAITNDEGDIFVVDTGAGTIQRYAIADLENAPSGEDEASN
jgi:predicted membrane-bound mannosyltransferase/sugar lactone lactonase YvrE